MIGFVAGSFDVIHPGYILLLEEAKTKCDFLIVALHNDPSFERPGKLKPILSLGDRKKILESIKFVDKVVVYNTEKDLEKLISTINPDIRFLGDDYKDKEYTASNLQTKISYICRDHGWSTTKFKNLIYKQLKN